MSKKNKADSYIVSMDDDGELNWIDETILNQYSEKADTDSKGSKEIEGEAFDYGLVLEPKYPPEELIELLDINTYHERCVNAIATDASGKGYSLVPVSDEISEEDSKPEVTRFLENCTPDINTLFYRCNYDRKSIGYGILEIVRETTSDSPLRRLNHVNAQKIRRHSDTVRAVQQVGNKKVYFIIYGKNKVTSKLKRLYSELESFKIGDSFDVDADTGDFCVYNSLSANQRANELIWDMDYAPGTNYYGRPEVIGSIGVIQGEQNRTRYNVSFFKNFGVPAVSVTVTGDFIDEDPEDPDYKFENSLKYKIGEQIKQVIRNPHSALVITVPSNGGEGNVKVDIQPLSVETKDASFRLFRKDNRDEIIHAHGVDPSRLGIYDSGKLNGSNSKTVDNSYKVSTIAPLKAENEKKINRLLRNEFEIKEWEFKITVLDPKDEAQDMVLAEKLFQMGAMTPRQLIENFGDKFGLKVEGSEYLDEYYLNGQPLAKLWQQTSFNQMYSDLDNLKDELITEDVEDDNQEPIEDSGISSKQDVSLQSRIRFALQGRN